MLISLNIDDVNTDNVLLGNKVENTIIQNSLFYRINYSTNKYSMNGIYICFSLKNVKTKIFYNKIKYDFSIKQNSEIIKKIIQLENRLLNINSILNKNPKFTIKEQLENENFKIFNSATYYNYPNSNNHYKYANNNTNNSFILKISGFWENLNEYGLTYKFINYKDNG
jgi:hypothetical protein